MSPTIPIENKLQVAILAIASAGSALTLVLVSLRYVGRWRRQGKLDWGDLWIGIAEFFLNLFHILCFLQVYWGGLGLHQEDVLARWGPEPVYILYKMTYAALVLVPTICFTKLSVLALYSQLMPFEEVHLWVRFTFTGTIMGGIAMTFGYLFLCSPVYLFWTSWDGRPVPGGHCGDLGKFVFWTGFLNSVADLSIVVLPMPWLYKLRLPLREKLWVMALFGFGMFIVAITIVRLWYCTTLTGSGATIDDFTHYGAWLAGLSSLEGTMTVTVACLPFLKSACAGRRRGRPPPGPRSAAAAGGCSPAGGRGGAPGGGGAAGRRPERQGHGRQQQQEEQQRQQQSGQGQGRGGGGGGGGGGGAARGWTRRWMRSLDRSRYKGLDSFASTTATTQAQDYELEAAASPAAAHHAPAASSRSGSVAVADDAAGAAGRPWDVDLEKEGCASSSVPRRVEREGSLPLPCGGDMAKPY